MIEFIEKEPWYDSSPFTGGCNMYPIFMVKDGNEFFMFNRREPDDKWKLEEGELRKKHLVSTDGAYFKFYGIYDSPFEMLKEISERKHHFVEPEDTYCYSIKNRLLDFHGNRKEVSAAFHYRIYDSDIAKMIKKAVEFLNDEKFTECEKFISECIKA